jgi:hypothetical protein
MGKAEREKGAAFERAVARDLSGRTGKKVGRNLGQAREGGDDITLPGLRIECKARKRSQVVDFIAQAKAACKAGEVPLVVLKADNRPWMVVALYEDVIDRILSAGTDHTPE